MDAKNAFEERDRAPDGRSSHMSFSRSASMGPAPTNDHKHRFEDYFGRNESVTRQQRWGKSGISVIPYDVRGEGRVGKGESGIGDWGEERKKRRAFQAL